VAVHNRLTRRNRLTVLAAEIATAVTAAEATTQGQHRQLLNHHRLRCEMPRATGRSPLPMTAAVGHFAPPLTLMSLYPNLFLLLVKHSNVWLQGPAR
jgi:hypothetical protein